MVNFLAFTGGGKPQVSLCALYLAQSGTRVEPTTFRKLSPIEKVGISLNDYQYLKYFTKSSQTIIKDIEYIYGSKRSLQICPIKLTDLLQLIYKKISLR